MINVFDVAKYILHAVGGEVSTMFLQKLCYYCQAWHLVWAGKPLFPEDFERWDNGPVCRELFNMHRGWGGISEEDIPSGLSTDEELGESDFDTINQIIEDYAIFNGAQLSEISHGEGPWKDTPPNGVISNEKMMEYYRGLIDGKK
jgi:uncharacterized phage-associated protein